MKYNEFIKLAKKNGWELFRQGKGSHQIWIKGDKKNDYSGTRSKRDA